MTTCLRYVVMGFLVFMIMVGTVTGFNDSKVSAAGHSGAFLKHQGPPPTGANRVGCHPNPKHPEPIVLVPGTFELMSVNWSRLSPALASKGYCVYSLNYGFHHGLPSTDDIVHSAQQLKAFVDNVLDLTGAEKVSIVGHSQGGMMPRYYLKYLGGADKVDDMVGLVPSNHGTKGLFGFRHLTTSVSNILDCTACHQQLTGSNFLTHLNQGNETPGDVSYTVVTTRNDEVVVPYRSAFLTGSNGQVANITLQDATRHPYIVGHISTAYDPNAKKLVLDALSHAGPANPNRVFGKH